MAAENGLWGAPRIHGALLKLGIAISERTVSRDLSGPADHPITHLADVPREPFGWPAMSPTAGLRGRAPC
jgi:hypothetical protein